MSFPDSGVASALSFSPPPRSSGHTLLWRKISVPLTAVGTPHPGTLAVKWGLGKEGTAGDDFLPENNTSQQTDR